MTIFTGSDDFLFENHNFKLQLFQFQLRIASKNLMRDRSRSEPGGVVGSVPEQKCAFFRIAFVGRRNFVISGRFF